MVIAEGPPSAFSRDYARSLVLDARQVLTAPVRWGEAEWVDFSLAVAGIGAVMLVDKPVYEEVQRNRTASVDDMAKVVESFGSYPSFGIMGVFYAAGSLFENDRARRVAMDAFASSLVGAGVITTTMKVIVGRRRPGETGEAYHFRPFGGDHSFPSGHTTQAFSLASVIAEYYDERWVDLTSYGIATLVGLARVEQGAHFPSDVLAGAIIGTLVGKSIVRYHQGSRTRVTIVPAAGDQTLGVWLKAEF
ncbi:MAG: phosphatase PAP2 family protein [Nitrospirae bacterium]|nr:phosphatase PAP2 family protein [Nitrospirota bacterium]